MLKLCEIKILKRNLCVCILNTKEKRGKLLAWQSFQLSDKRRQKLHIPRYREAMLADGKFILWQYHFFLSFPLLVFF